MNTQNNPYLTSDSGSAELIIKRSRFIGSIAPVESEEKALAFVRKISDKHPDATHNVYCYTIRDDNKIRFSDAGEPSGTAGKPALDVLLKNNVWNCCIVITRYFGGTLLGAGGLVRAYSSCASAALFAAGIVRMEPMLEVFVSSSYQDWARVAPALEAVGFSPASVEYGANVDALYAAAPEQLSIIESAVKDASAGRSEVFSGEISMRGRKI